MIVTIPVFHAIKKHYPHLRIEVIASPRNKGMIEHDPQVDEIHLYTKNIFKDLALIMKLRRRRFDIVYDPICHDSTTGLLLSRIIGRGAVRAAARKLKLRSFYDYCRPYLPDGTDHNIDNGFLIFEVFGINPDSVDPFLPIHLPEESRRKADHFWMTLPDNGSFRVGLNISAGSRTRTLEIEKYIEIVNYLHVNHPNLEFVILCVMADRHKAEDLMRNIRAASYLIPEHLSLLDVAAIIKRLDLLISPDTSMIHIARLMKIPVVGLYSGHKRNFHFWRPYRQKHGAVVAVNIDNIFDIMPDQVVSEFELLIEEIGYSEKSPSGKDH